MRSLRERRKAISRFCRRHKLAAACIFLALIAVAGVGTYVGVEATSTVGFCTQCHEMQPAYESYLASSHYNVADPSRRATCRDCHVPPWSHPLAVIWTKTSHGVRDIYVHLTSDVELTTPGFYQKLMASSPHGIHNASCLKCHEDVYGAEVPGRGNIHRTVRENDDSRCTDCHRNLVHYPYKPGGRE